MSAPLGGAKPPVPPQIKAEVTNTAKDNAKKYMEGLLKPNTAAAGGTTANESVQAKDVFQQGSQQAKEQAAAFKVKADAAFIEGQNQYNKTMKDLVGKPPQKIFEYFYLSTFVTVPILGYQVVSHSRTKSRLATTQQSLETALKEQEDLKAKVTQLELSFQESMSRAASPAPNPLLTAPAASATPVPLSISSPHAIESLAAHPNLQQDNRHPSIDFSITHTHETIYPGVNGGPNYLWDDNEKQFYLEGPDYWYPEDEFLANEFMWNRNLSKESIQEKRSAIQETRERIRQARLERERLEREEQEEEERRQEEERQAEQRRGRSASGAQRGLLRDRDEDGTRGRSSGSGGSGSGTRSESPSTRSGSSREDFRAMRARARAETAAKERENAFEDAFDSFDASSFLNPIASTPAQAQSQAAQRSRSRSANNSNAGEDEGRDRERRRGRRVQEAEESRQQQQQQQTRPARQTRENRENREQDENRTARPTRQSRAARAQQEEDATAQATPRTRTRRSRNADSDADAAQVSENKVDEVASKAENDEQDEQNVQNVQNVQNSQTEPAEVAQTSPESPSISPDPALTEDEEWELKALETAEAQLQWRQRRAEHLRRQRSEARRAEAEAAETSEAVAEAELEVALETVLEAEKALGLVEAEEEVQEAIHEVIYGPEPFEAWADVKTLEVPLVDDAAVPVVPDVVVNEKNDV